MSDKNTIEYLAYLLDKAKKENKEKAIVFLGAGTSVTAGIPLTNVIVRHIKLKFRNNPIIGNLNDYYKLMGALTADERRDLFHYYVTREKVKLNMANVYLAQLLKEGYVDYILTVNFDDLIMRACTLYGFLPPVYDVSNIKTITTTDIRTGSVLYLHGQYFGQWLLNNEEELKKVENEVLNLFNNIKTRRTWIVVGYSGNDGIFDKIKTLGSFSSEFFWVKKELNNTTDEHILEFIKTPNINANKIEGYYADSFFLKLHAELSKLNDKLLAPDIFYKPFTHLKSIMQNVKDIDETDDLSLKVKSIIESANNRIEKAVSEFENKKSLEHLKQEIIDAILKKDFSEEKVKIFEDEINTYQFNEAKEELFWYFGEWGNTLCNLANTKQDKNLFHKCFEKYQKASELSSNDSTLYYNWGTALYDLAKLTQDENLFHQCFEKFKIASNLRHKSDALYYNWGCALSYLATIKQDEELFQESFEKYQKASELNPENDSIYNNWGIALSKLAQIKQFENLFQQGFDKYHKALELNPSNDSIYNNWGNALYAMAKIKQDETLFQQSFDKYHKANELNPFKDSVYRNWGNALSDLAKIKQDENLFQQSFDKYHKASELNFSNDSTYKKWGNALSDLAEIKQDENLFQQSFEKYLKASKLNPIKDSIYNDWGNALFRLTKIKLDETLYQQSFEKYQKASELNPERDAVYYNWGTALLHFANSKQEPSLYRQSFERFQIANELNPNNLNTLQNWGIALSKLAFITQDENLFYQSFDKFQKAAELNPKAHAVYYNWGSALLRLSKLNKDETVLNESETVLIKGFDLGSKKYHLACCYALQKKKEKALKILQIALENKEETAQFVKDDEDWDNFKNDGDFIALLAKY
jgi:tetratricopeptide (TPR) repeat protein